MSSADSHISRAPSDAAGDAHIDGSAIQEHISRLTIRCQASLDSVIAAANGAPAEAVRKIVHSGFRDGVVNCAVTGCPSESIAEVVCDAIRRRAEAYARNNDHGQSLDAEWLDTHFGVSALRQRLVISDTDESAIAVAVGQIQDLAHRITLAHDRLACDVARLFVHPHLDRGDLQQEARIALRRAALRFDPSDGTPFSAYARSVIRHHLVDVLRDASGPTHHQARQVLEFIDCESQLRGQLGREPGEDEVFDSLRWDVSKRKRVRAVIRIFRPQRLPVSGEETAGIPIAAGTADPPTEAIRSETTSALVAALSRLNAALERLPSEQREIINLRHFQGLSFPQIAEHLGLTPRKVQLRHDKILAALEEQVRTSDSAKAATGSA